MLRGIRTPRLYAAEIMDPSVGARFNENHAAILLAAVTITYGFHNASTIKLQREKEISEHPKVQRTPSATLPQDHPVATWLITNGAVWAVVWLKFKFGFALKTKDSSLMTFAKLFFGNILTVDGCMAINYVLINHVYAHVPFFTHKRMKQSYKDILRDYLKCNTVVNVLGAVIQGYLFHWLKKGELQEKMLNQPWRPLRFLLRLIWVRVLVDAGFWLGHSSLHSKKMYTWAHSTHHEHSATQLTTNYHFEWQDLVIEAFLPFLASILLYETLIGSVDQFDMTLLGTYIFWHEIESHAGKPMPTMPLIAPLSTFTSHLDDWNSWFHEIHHRVLKSNFSITPWFDQLMGTDRWDL